MSSNSIGTCQRQYEDSAGILPRFRMWRLSRVEQDRVSCSHYHTKPSGHTSQAWVHVRWLGVQMNRCLLARLPTYYHSVRRRKLLLQSDPGSLAHVLFNPTALPQSVGYCTSHCRYVAARLTLFIGGLSRFQCNHILCLGRGANVATTPLFCFDLVGRNEAHHLVH